MGRGDVLDTRNTYEGGRPSVQYRKGPGEATGFTRFRPGWGGRTFLDTVAAQGGPPAPPPGYVPELIRHQGRTVSTLDMERATPRTLSPTPMPSPPNTPYPPARGGSPYNDGYSPQELADMLYWMERARRERRPALKGLFGGGE